MHVLAGSAELQTYSVGISPRGQNVVVRVHCLRLELASISCRDTYWQERERSRLNYACLPRSSIPYHGTRNIRAFPSIMNQLCILNKGSLLFAPCISSRPMLTSHNPLYPLCAVTGSINQPNAQEVSSYLGQQHSPRLIRVECQWYSLQSQL